MYPYDADLLFNCLRTIYRNTLYEEEYDADRQAALEEQGYRVVRFSNQDVLRNMEGVLEMVFELCTSPA